MRVAQYKLPKVAADAEDASLVLYYFGQGQVEPLLQMSNDGWTR